MSGQLKFKVDTKAFERDLERLASAANKDGIAKVVQAAEKVMTVAKQRTPVDSGALRSSGLVTKVSETSVELSFGGAASAYAVIVHENLTNYHPVGQAKFLESAITDWQNNGGLQELGRAIGSVLKGAA